MTSAVNGTIFPLFALLFAAILNTFSKIDRPDELRSEANFLSGINCIAFFDSEDNGTGILTAKLAVDATKIEGLQDRLTAVTISLGVGFAFAYGWKLTLVVVATAPTVGIAIISK
ncbi:unnamed protein product [Rhizophagus irregularis]|nr:unnamed protein product [Rhizophagus irregularis]